jgi:N6-L-threonylcarbamoyladenine synthase
VFYPEFEFCTDNGAMIALAGALRLGAGFGANTAAASLRANVVARTYAFTVKPRWDLATLVS